MSENNEERVIHLPVELVARVDQLAHERRMSRDQFVLLACSAYLLQVEQLDRLAREGP